jgi:hypothetical protein
MKTLIVALALVGAVASQASAQDTQPDQTKTVRHHRIVVHPTVQRHAANPATDVYAPNGQYVGSDPDPVIRDSMWFDSALLGND